MATPPRSARPLSASPARALFPAASVRVLGVAACLTLAPLLLSACSANPTAGPPTSGAPTTPATGTPPTTVGSPPWVQRLRVASASAGANVYSIRESIRNQDRAGLETVCGDLNADVVSLRASLPTGNDRVDVAARRVIDVL